MKIYILHDSMNELCDRWAKIKHNPPNFYELDSRDLIFFTERQYEALQSIFDEITEEAIRDGEIEG